LATEDLGNGKEMIDALIQFGLELDLADAYVTTEWIPRAKFAVQIAVNEFWRAGDWDIKFPSTTLTLLAANSDWAEAPADFLRVGAHGGLYVFGKTKIDYRDPERFLRERRVIGNSYATYPRFYTIRGQTANRLPKILFMLPIDPAGANLDIDLFYEARRPQVLYATTAGANGIDVIPVEYRHDIIYVGALDYLRYDGGDARTIMQISPGFKRAVLEAAGQRLHQLDGVQQIADEGIADEGMW
jgi:hypothetical protein